VIGRPILSRLVGVLSCLGMVMGVGMAVTVVGSPSAVSAADSFETAHAYQMIATKRVGINKNDCLEAFVRYGDGNIWQTRQTEPGSTWSSWVNIGGAAAGDPVVAVNKDARLELFVRGSDDRLRTQVPTVHTGSCALTWDSARWQTDDTLGVGVAGDPAVASNRDGRLQVFVRGSDNNVWYKTQHEPGSEFGERWTGWKMLTTTGTFVGDPVLGMDSGGRIHVFARASDGSLWTVRQLEANVDAWGAWTVVSDAGTVQGDPAVARDADGRLQVFMRGADNRLYYEIEAELESGVWGNPSSSLSSYVFGDPAVATNTDGRLEVFGRGAGNVLVHEIQVQPGSETSWGAPGDLAGSFTGTPSVGINANGKLDVFVLDSNGTMSHRMQNSPSAAPGNDWASWENLGSGADPCTSPGTLSCLHIVNPQGHVLTPATDEADSWVDLQASSNAANQYWSVVPHNAEHGTFSLVNRATNRCLNVRLDFWGAGYRTFQDECGTNPKQWYLQPVDETRQSYLIKEVDTPDHCMYSMPGHVAGSVPVDYDPRGRIQAERCTTHEQYQWRLGVSGNAYGALALAIRYGLAQCGRDSATCGFSVADNLPSAYQEVYKCLPGTLYYNATGKTQTAIPSVSFTSSWEFTVSLGGSVTHKVEAGVAGVVQGEVDVAVQLTLGAGYTTTQTVTTNSYISLEPGDYGWLEKDLVKKRITGDWAFNGSGTPWAIPGSNVIPVKEGADNVYSGATKIASGKVPPANC
jgi:hypothetical protein